MKATGQMRCTYVLRQLGSIGFVAFLCSASAHAQESLVGKYVGSFLSEFGGRVGNVAITLEIITAENGKLAGKIAHHGGVCAGDYVLDGNYEGAKLDIDVGKGGKLGCGGYKINVTTQGKKLTGKLGNFNVDMSKQ